MDKNNVNSKSVGKNAILNILKTLLSIVFPLITFPYVTRVLGVDNLGKVNFANSIVSYFALFAALGISTYSVREGSRLRDYREKLENFVKEILSINIISTFIVYVLLLLAVLFVDKLKLYSVLILIQSLSIVFTTIGVEWINVIYEDYVYITIRSFLVQVLSLACLFLFVKKQGDYYIYAGIIALGQGVISVLNIIHIRKYCRIRVGIPREIKKHIKPIMVLFSNNIAVAIYVNSDTTMLGWITGDYDVGLYAVSVKIYTIIKQLIAAIYTVVMARLSYYLSIDDKEKYIKLLNQVVNTIITLSIPATIGLSCISEEVIEVLAGHEYIQATTSLRILSIAFFFAIMGGLIANCINLPFKRESINLKATGLSAIVNIGLNLFLIPAYRHNGAAFTTLISEIVVSTILMISIKNRTQLLKLKSMMLTIIKSLVAGSVIVIIAIIFKNILHLNGWLYIVTVVAFGSLAYGLASVLLKNRIVLFFLMEIKKRVKRNG